MTILIDARPAPAAPVAYPANDPDIYTHGGEPGTEPGTAADTYIWHVSNQADETLKHDTAITLSEAQMAVVTCIAGNPSTATHGTVRYDGKLWRCDVTGGLITWYQPAAGPPFVCGGCGESIANCICPPLSYVP